MRLSFELNEEVKKGRIQSLLVTAAAVVYRAVGFTVIREIIVGGHVCHTGRVDDFQFLE